MSHRIQHRTGKSFLILVILSITLFIAVLGMELLAGFMNRQIFVTDIRQSGYGTYAAEEMLAQQKVDAFIQSVPAPLRGVLEKIRRKES